MTQQHRTTRTVYRGASADQAHFGGSPAPDEVWTVTYSDEPPLAAMRTYDEIIASVGIVVDLTDELDRVERVCAAGEASLHFPIGDGVDLGVTLYPGDLSTIRRALDAIEREWARLGVYAAGPEQPADDPAMPTGRGRTDLNLPLGKCVFATAGTAHGPHEYDLDGEVREGDTGEVAGTRVRCAGWPISRHH